MKDTISQFTLAVFDFHQWFHIKYSTIYINISCLSRLRVGVFLPFSRNNQILNQIFLKNKFV